MDLKAVISLGIYMGIKSCIILVACREFCNHCWYFTAGCSAGSRINFPPFLGIWGLGFAASHKGEFVCGQTRHFLDFRSERMGESVPSHLWKPNWGNMHPEKCHKMLHGCFTSKSAGRDTTGLYKAYNKWLCKAAAAEWKYRKFYYMQRGASFSPHISTCYRKESLNENTPDPE